MMPSMRAKHERNLAKKKVKGNWLPRGLIVEIALYFSRKIKDAMHLIRVDRKFKKCLHDTSRFWYLICLSDCLKPTYNYIVKLLGKPPIRVHNFNIVNSQ